VAVRIAPSLDASLIAMPIGKVRRVLCAAPDYLARMPPITTPADLAEHHCIAVAQMAANEIWSFPPAPGSRIARTVRIKPRLMVNADEAAVDAAVAGEGVVRLISYKIDREVRAGRLVVLLEQDELPLLPVHLIVPEGRLAVARVRAFVDFARPRLKTEFASMSHPWPATGQPARNGDASHSAD
jgi:DNA-binding transcriptional LysR family regulator